MADYRAAKTIVYNPEIEKFLLIKRAKSQSPNPDTWEFPGGGLEQGEKPRQAALRELEEETGLKAEIVKKGEKAEISVEKGELEINPYLVKTRKEKIELSEEHTDYKWLKIDRIASFTDNDGVIKSLKSVDITRGY